jgi:hypothetical protein
MQPVDFARLAQRAYTDAPTVGLAGSASRMHVYDGVHVFRGTDNFGSLVADGDISVIDVAGLGRVHAGFYAALAAILPACLALPRPTAIAGHSLGAAMAVLYGGVLALLGDAVPIYAFEPPRVTMDGTLNALLIGSTVPWFATRNGRDVITQVPPSFQHAGPITAIGRAVLPFDNLGDHAIARIVEALT